MAKELTLKMAKASDKDREAVKEFAAFMESITDYGTAEINGKEWEPDDEQLGGTVREWFKKHGSAMFRVVWGFETLVENCCDPEADTLEWRKDVEAAMQAAGIEQ